MEDGQVSCPFEKAQYFLLLIQNYVMALVYFYKHLVINWKFKGIERNFVLGYEVGWAGAKKSTTKKFVPGRGSWRDTPVPRHSSSLFET